MLRVTPTNVIAALLGERVSSEFEYRKGTEIFGKGHETAHVYQVVAGATRICRLLPDED